jgi:hypothetical protein
MEALTRLVSDSLARHGLDRPVDPRRLQWSRWFRCDSPHSLLVVPSKPGIFAIAEAITDLSADASPVGKVAQACPERPRAERGEVERKRPHVGTAALGCPAERSSAAATAEGISNASVREQTCSGAALQDCESSHPLAALSAAEATSKRMLAVIQFSEDDNMAYVLDRMFTWVNPLRSRLHSGNCFVRFVVVEDQQQRRSICAALNQWMRNSSEKATGLPADFSSSVELASEDVARAPSPAAFVRTRNDSVGVNHLGSVGDSSPLALSIEADSGANKNLHCPQPFPSGF